MNRIVMTVLTLTLTITVQILTDTLTVHLKTVGFLTVAGDRFLFGALLQGFLSLHVAAEAFV